MDFRDEDNCTLLSELRMMDTHLEENSRYINYALLLLPIFDKTSEEQILSLKLVVRHLIVLGEQDPAMERVHRRVLQLIVSYLDGFGSANDRMEMWMWILNELMGYCGASFAYETLANACRYRAAFFYEDQLELLHSRDLLMTMTFANVETHEADSVTEFDACVNISFYSLALRDLKTFDAFLTRAESLARPLTDNVQQARYDYLVGRHMDMSLYFGGAASHFLRLAGCPVVLSADSDLMARAIVNTVLTPDLKLYYSLFDLFVQNNNWCTVPAQEGILPFLLKLFSDDQICISDLQLFARIMLPHQHQPDSNGTTPLIAAMIRHNICAYGMITHFSQVSGIADSLEASSDQVIAIVFEMLERQELFSCCPQRIRQPDLPPPTELPCSVHINPWIHDARANLAQTAMRGLEHTYPNYQNADRQAGTPNDEFKSAEEL